MAAKKLERLTPEQEAQFGPWRDRWLDIGLRTGPADRENARRGVELAYQAAGLPAPRLTIWLRSPLEGAYGAALLSSVVAQVGDQVGDQVEDQVRDQVGDQVEAQVEAQVEDQVWARVRAQVWAQVWAQVGDQVWARVRARVEDQVWDQIWRAAYGQHDAGWLSFYTFFREHCEINAAARLDGLALVAESAGWWWPFEDAVILTERPTRMERDAQGRLHSDTGAALLYPDGFGIWAWHGVRVPQRVIEQPDTLTVADALMEPNTEVRRVMLDRIGPERMAREGGLVVVDAVADDQVEIDTGHDGLPMPVGLRGGKLLRVETGADTPAMQWVSLLNSTPEPDGSIKPYMLRVPPTVRTVREAVAWTFDVPTAEYQPMVES